MFKTKFIIFIFRVSGSCKDVGALLRYIEQEVRLGNNQWHVPPKKQRLHGPSILSEIETKKLRQEKILRKKNNKTDCCSKFDPRAKVDRKTNPMTDNEVTTTKHIETIKSIYNLVDEYKPLNSNWEEYDHDFVCFLKLDKSQATYIYEQTRKQSNSNNWYTYRQGRIAASIFYEVVLKVSEI